MCGIAGILNFDGAPVAPARVRAMTACLAHRGPNDEGFRFAPGVGLGMRRLSILDVAGGHQPIANEDRTVWVVFNGELYNFVALRRELESAGHRFETATDTEILVHLYEEHGEAFVERLRGMFAFALWDERRRRLLLARDRLGIKPLYWARIGDELLFASELKSILALDEAEPRFDWESLAHLLAYSTTPAARSIVDGVRKLEPGCLLAASAEAGVAIRRYWRVRFEPDERRTEGEWCEALRAALVESVDLHRVSDVPLGAFLSGGVDSSSVVAALAGLSPQPVRTFSIGFRDPAYDELDAARLVAKRFGTEHHEEVVEPEVAGELERIAWHLDEPFGDSSAIPTFVVSGLAARGVTVVLSGDGGDELFAGYDRYRVERRERANRFLPAPVRRILGALGASLEEGATGREMLRHLALTGIDRYLDANRLFRDDQLDRLLTPEARARTAGFDPRSPALRSLEGERGHWLSALQRFDLEAYLPLDILTKVDRMSMAHSIEARVPLLDHPLVELAARIPPRLQLRGASGKYLFKRALRGMVPDPILDRPKRGFAIPLGHWFRGRLGPYVRDLLLAPESVARGIFQPDYVRTLLRLHDAGRPLDLQLWTLLSFELWCRCFVDKRRAERPAAEPATAPARAAAGGAR